MPSAPTTSTDLDAPALAADPYPTLARLRALGPVVRHEPSGRLLVLGHAAVAAAQRDRRLGRVWRDREPADLLEPFNLLHRHQMLEHEPPTHTRLRRPVAAAFARGHVERLRPRVRALAAALLDEVDPTGLDLVGDLAEPLPVLVIAALIGVPETHVDALRAWSQAIVAMYEPSPPLPVAEAAARASVEFADFLRDLLAHRRAAPRDDLLSHLAEVGLDDDEVVASVVLLLNAGHEASVNALGNGMVAWLRQDGVARLPGGADATARCVEELLRHDAPLQLFEREALVPADVGGVPVEPGQRVALLLGAANRDPAVFARPDRLDPARHPNPHLSFGVGVHFCLGAPLARMELRETLDVLLTRLPDLHLAGEPESRGTFVLRGHRRVPVAASGPGRRRGTPA
ncbi:cytochrome P450 [Nocardioides sp. TRM66260-LWL]|uniref:cytochrome P450 n=1 Tax=Nocardioides sp. TRM66260-LWL TaxID=2874478 RepID=UPI001CC44BDE|nr:cytochrome P450 [Nocardioides sp. TRM66260-LWL]MBZ5733258.1 cytochrome P450 [Nocardioides sp. TRM66260-LWL]